MNDIDLNRLRIFREVVALGSFSRAAEKLHQPKSRVSRNVSALESELGVQLIQRTTRQFRLTEEGLTLSSSLNSLLTDLDNALVEVSSGVGEVTGRLRVTVPEDIGVELMGGICAEFLASHPKVYLNLHVGNQIMNLLKESIDIALRIGQGRDSSMIQKKIGIVRLELFASPALIQKWGRSGKIEDLEAWPYLAFNPQDSLNHSVRLTSERQTRTLKLKSVFGSNNFFALRAMASLGMGFTQLPSFLGREPVEKGLLVPLFKNWSADPVPLMALIPHQKEIPLRTRRFIDFVSNRLVSVLK